MVLQTLFLLNQYQDFNDIPNYLIAHDSISAQSFSKVFNTVEAVLKAYGVDTEDVISEEELNNDEIVMKLVYRKDMAALDFEDAVKLFKTTALLALDQKIDAFLVETMNDAYEAKAAIIAVKEAMEEKTTINRNQVTWKLL